MRQTHPRTRWDPPHTKSRERSNSVDERRLERNCSECYGRLVTDIEHAETTCTDCGLVFEESEVDRGPEWRAYSSFECDRKSRVGHPTTNLLHDKGLSSHIDWRNRDAYGNALNKRQRQQVRRLRIWDERFRTRDSKERNLKQALGEIERMASALTVPRTARETASGIYRRALAEDLLPGHSIEAVATAALYAAIRQTGLPRSVTEVAGVSRVDEREFTRGYRYIGRELGLEIGPPDPGQYVSRFASALDVSNETERRARELIRTAADQDLHIGKSPVGLAAAALYAAATLTDEVLLQATISETANVSTVTIRNQYPDLLAAAQIGIERDPNRETGEVIV